MKVLVVDDQPHVRQALALLFSLRGVDVVSASGPEEALEIQAREPLGVVVQDMNFRAATTSGEEGAALFRALRQVDPELPVILMTAWGSFEMAVALVKEGAADYLQKPWDDELLLRKVQNLLAARRAAAPASTSSATFDDCGLVYESAEMAALLRLARKVAPSPVPVLITGANGVGKEKIAEVVQRNSERAERPFVKLNIGALPDELFEAELFGAEAGAFTGATKLRLGRFETAHGGTLFLDEMGTISSNAQAKLLRVLQTGELQRLGSSRTQKVDVRVIAATNADLRAEIAAGRFREDLYYRLAVIELAVPSLVERIDDVLPLAHHFARRFGSAGVRFADDAVAALLAHEWPGNVRERENAVRRAALMAEGELVRADDLGLVRAAVPRRAEPAPRPGAGPVAGLSHDERVERDRIERALDESDYVVARAASALGLSRQALYRRMRRLDLTLSRGVT